MRVRVIGDPVLRQPGMLFPDNYTDEELLELNRQIDIAKEILIQTGGGGIAANQCAEIENPWQFTIVGVFHESEQHVAGVTRRYPSVQFPQAMIMVNPILLANSETTQVFNHACLGVPCPNRCAVESPEKMTVQYRDPTENMSTVIRTLKDKAAVALWHELNHILDGKTYIDTALASLDDKDLADFITLVAEEINSRAPHQQSPEFSAPPFYFSITFNEKKHAILNRDVLKAVLPKMNRETLLGIELRAEMLRAEADRGHCKAMF